jgi:hypothetical protein
MSDAPGAARPVHHADAERCVDAVLATVGKDIVLGLPLGLGKVYRFANALYERAARDPSLKLTIFTALTLDKPIPSSELERRFFEPIVERLFGGCPELAYARARREDRLPANIEVHEFFFQTANCSIRQVRNRTTSAPTTPMRRVTCWRAASTCWASWSRNASKMAGRTTA